MAPSRITEGQRAAIAGDRFVEPAEILQRRAEVVVQFDRIRPEAQRPFEIGDRPIRLPELLACVAEVVEGIDRVRGERERSLVTRHRLAGPVEGS